MQKEVPEIFALIAITHYQNIVRIPKTLADLIEGRTELRWGQRCSRVSQTLFAFLGTKASESRREGNS